MNQPGHHQFSGIIKVTLTAEQKLRLHIGWYSYLYFNRLFRYVHIQNENGQINKTLICLN